jgi:hypothetical protein
MTQRPTASCSGVRPKAAATFRYSGSGDMVWRGILARPVYAISNMNVLLVGVNSLGTRSYRGDELDRLNAEVTAIVALKQSEYRNCDTVYAILLHENHPMRLRHIDVSRIQCRLDDCYFAQIRSRILKLKVVPSAVVSFIIQQRLFMKNLRQSAM